MIVRILLLALTTIATAGAAFAEPREVRIASHVSALSPLHQQSRMFADEVGRRLPGQFDFKLYPGGQLGKEKALITSVKAGSIEMINVASGVLKLDKKLGVFDLPWLFNDRAHVKRAMAGGLEAAIRERLEKKAGVVVIGVYENGFRHVINKVKPIVKPLDFKGLKVRISGGKFRQAVFRQMGATPQKIAWKETFTALQTGVVDGVEAATYGFYEQKHYEVTKNLSLTHHVYTPSFLIVSRAFFDSLTPAQQEVFRQAGRDITEAAYRGAAKLEADYFAEMKSKLAINEIDLKAFKQATAASFANYRQTQGDDFLKLVEAAR